MDHSRNNDRPQKNENIDEMINEASAELGVDLNTKSIDEDPKDLAKRIKQMIRKRKRTR